MYFVCLNKQKDLYSFDTGDSGPLQFSVSYVYILFNVCNQEEYAKSNKSLPRIEGHDNEKDNLRRKVSELQAKVSALENQDGTSKQEVERVKKEYREKKDALLLKWREVLEKKEAEALEKETNFQEQIDDLKRQLKSKEDFIVEIRKALSELRVEKDQVEKEKTEALTR